MTSRISPPTVIGLLLLGGVNVWLLALISREVQLSGSVVSETIEWTPKLRTVDQGDQKKAKVDNYKHVIERPVFFKTREPFVLPPPAPPTVVRVAPAPPIIDPGFVITGIMIVESIKRVYMSSRGNGAGVWASEGDNIGGWKIVSVNRNSAKLEQNGRVLEVSLFPQ